jgi:hypothetical protein
VNILSRRGARVAGAVVTIAAASCVAPAAGAAQEATAVDSLRREVASLRAQLDSLVRVVARLQAERPDTAVAAGPTDELDAIRAAAEAAAAAGEPQADTAQEAPTRFVGRQRAQQELNPEITVTGDLFALADLDGPDGENFVPREIEVSLQSSLDPYSLAKVFVGIHTPGGELLPFADPPSGDPGGEEVGEEEGHGAEIELEEAYVQWSGLGGGLNLSLGRFRQGFGTLNRWHPHALPGQAYPLPYTAFFGDEGLTQTGVRVHWLAPWSGLGTWELWTEVTASENEALYGETRKPAVPGRINGFWDLNRSTYFEIGVNGIAGPDMRNDENWGTRVGGADFTLSWRPPERSRYREATLRGGVVYGALAPEGADPGEAWGGFLIGDYRLGQRWVLGGRYEYTENPIEPTESAWLAAPTLTWWQSEWVRLRAELDYLDRPDGVQKLLLFQATFAMGPHKHETY